MSTTVESRRVEKLPHTIFSLQQAEGQVSVFFLPDIGGNVFYANKIIKHIDPRHRIYGIRLDSEITENLSDHTMETLGEKFAADINASVLRDSIILVGHSFAGYLAYETASQLEKLNKRVSMVVLLDSGVPGRFYLGWHYRLRTMSRAIKTRLRAFLSNTAKGCPFADRKVVLHTTGFLRMDLSKHPEAYQKILRSFYRALTLYEPGPYGGGLTLIRAAGHHPPHADPEEMGWDRYVEGDIEVIRVPGNHLELVRDDVAAEAVARRLEKIIETVRNFDSDIDVSTA